MPFTTESAKVAGAKGGKARGKKQPISPQVILNKSLHVLNDALDAGSIQAASRVLGVLYDAGVKPTTRDDQLGEAIKGLLSPPAEPPPAAQTGGGTEAPKKEGGS
jgi:hypothetical protein